MHQAAVYIEHIAGSLNPLTLHVELLIHTVVGHRRVRPHLQVLPDESPVGVFWDVRPGVHHCDIKPKWRGRRSGTFSEGSGTKNIQCLAFKMKMVGGKYPHEEGQNFLEY